MGGRGGDTSVQRRSLDLQIKHSRLCYISKPQLWPQGSKPAQEGVYIMPYGRKCAFQAVNDKELPSWALLLSEESIAPSWDYVLLVAVCSPYLLHQQPRTQLCPSPFLHHAAPNLGVWVCLSPSDWPRPSISHRWGPWPEAVPSGSFQTCKEAGRAPELARGNVF